MLQIEVLMQYHRAEIYILREDLLPFSYGGNKLRIAEEIFAEMKQKGCDAVVSYGSPASNLNRVVAQMAAKEGLSCRVIYKEETNKKETDKKEREEGAASRKEERFITTNEQLVQKSGAVLLSCERDGVREAVRNTMETLRKEGKKPYYVYGDESGHGNEAVLMRAYEKVYKSLLSYEAEKGVSFSHIFLATGTGMTQSGLLLGQLKYGGTANIRGVSVARSREQSEAVIRENLEIAMKESAAKALNICVTDDYLFGGYGAYGKEIEELIEGMEAHYRLPLDPTYTAKSFYGMLKEIDRGGIEGKVLFIHTGGYPGYLDFRKRQAG